MKFELYSTYEIEGSAFLCTGLSESQNAAVLSQVLSDGEGEQPYIEWEEGVMIVTDPYEGTDIKPVSIFKPGKEKRIGLNNSLVFQNI
ncbi:hypothetical protein [Paenibacillus sp. FSL R10-2734]|uniref:hypothetical protein n=1 Tax=Paenibacillus sp. FSL R10-2734 TaxID=2954691 RepID=UPI0030DC7173